MSSAFLASATTSQSPHPEALGRRSSRLLDLTRSDIQRLRLMERPRGRVERTWRAGPSGPRGRENKAQGFYVGHRCQASRVFFVLFSL